MADTAGIAYIAYIAYIACMRHSEFWTRLEHHLGPGFAQAWARDQVLVELDFRTVTQALEAGDPVLAIWRAAWKALELPPSEY